MFIAYLALGSNLNTPVKQCRKGIMAIRRWPQSVLIKAAPFYLNKAQGRKAMPDYINTVVALYTRLPPYQLLRQAQLLEKKHGRTRKVRWGARTLDIDIILYPPYRLRQARLTIPHPRYLLRDFVYLPLQELITLRQNGCPDILAL